MHVHLTLFWNIALGIIGSIIGARSPMSSYGRQMNDIIPPDSSSPRWARFFRCLSA
jgi:hypothetical protein